MGCIQCLRKDIEFEILFLLRIFSMKTVKHMLAMIQLVLILIMGAPRKQEQRQQGSSSQL